MNRITVVGEMNPYASYGQISYEVIRHLLSRGYWPAVRPVGTHPGTPQDIARLFVPCAQPEGKEIYLSPPARMPTPRQKTLYLTMWESTELPPNYVDNLNLCDVVTVPSVWNQESFKASGVEVPIEVTHLGVDPGIYRYQPYQDGGMCIFGAAGNLHNGAKRKGLQDVIGCFKRVFKGVKNVRLWIKSIGEELKDEDPRIISSFGLMTEKQMAEWYKQLSCFCSFARAEGWGLMQHQALAVGRPVIAASYAGLAEFLTPEVGYPVLHKIVDAEENWEGYGVWCEPDMDHFEVCMEQVYVNREESINKGKAASKVAGTMTWEKTGDRLLDLVDKWLA